VSLAGSIRNDINGTNAAAGEANTVFFLPHCKYVIKGLNPACGDPPGKWKCPHLLLTGTRYWFVQNTTPDFTNH